MLRVVVACSPERGSAFECEIELPAPATAWDAVSASGVLERWPELAASAANVGIWGRATSPDALLGDGDRVELYRPLTFDPQEARRRRAAQERRRKRRRPTCSSR